MFTAKATKNTVLVRVDRLELSKKLLEAHRKGEPLSARDLGWAALNAIAKAQRLDEADPERFGRAAFKAWENAADWALGMAVLTALQAVVKRRIKVPAIWLKVDGRNYEVLAYGLGDEEPRMWEEVK